MSVFLVRTLIVYLALIAIMRFLGKRQIGEMQVSELVTAFLLSDIASVPLTSAEVPLSFAFVPIITLTCIEVVLSFLPTKFSFFKKILDGSPSIIIANGKIDRREMTRMRITLEELLCELHIAGYGSPCEVEYAILEPNGKLSFFANPAASAPKGMAHPVIIDGKIADYALAAAKKSREWLARELEKRKTAQKDVFLMTVDDGGKATVITKEGTL